MSVTDASDQPIVRWLSFNVNHNVRVKLTDQGREIHRRNFEAFVKDCPGFPYPYSKPEEDSEGWSKWQLWQLMKEFGPHMNMGLVCRLKLRLSWTLSPPNVPHHRAVEKDYE